MTNNDVLRRLRYVFDIADTKLVHMSTSVGGDAELGQVKRWLKQDDDPYFKPCADNQLATILNGFIVLHRGKQDSKPMPNEKTLNNNIILRKLKIALNLKSDDIIALLSSAGLTISEHELSAFFRKPEHKHFRQCKDQILRNFLEGLRLKHRPDDAQSR